MVQFGLSGFIDYGLIVFGMEFVVEGLRGELDCFCLLRLGCLMMGLVGLYEFFGIFKFGFLGYYVCGVIVFVF